MVLSPPTDYEKQALERLLGTVLDRPEKFELSTFEEKLATLNTIKADCSARAAQFYGGSNGPLFEYYKRLSDYYMALSDADVIRLAIFDLREGKSLEEHNP